MAASAAPRTMADARAANGCLFERIRESTFGGQVLRRASLRVVAAFRYTAQSGHGARPDPIPTPIGLFTA
jgi:hypothetical protein